MKDTNLFITAYISYIEIVLRHNFVLAIGRVSCDNGETVDIASEIDSKRAIKHCFM